MAKRTTKELNDTLRSLDTVATQQKLEASELRYPPTEITEADTRKKIAQRFVFAYFGIMLILIIGVPVYNLFAIRVDDKQDLLIINLSDILQTYSAIVGPALGFVIAYYFKNKNES